MHVYIELFRAKDAWGELSAEQRAAYMQRVGSSLQSVLDAGGELIGVGGADRETSRSAGYDFYSVWKPVASGAHRPHPLGRTAERWMGYVDGATESGVRSAVEVPEERW